MIGLPSGIVAPITTARESGADVIGRSAVGAPGRGDHGLAVTDVGVTLAAAAALSATITGAVVGCAGDLGVVATRGRPGVVGHGARRRRRVLARGAGRRGGGRRVVIVVATAGGERG